MKWLKIMYSHIIRFTFVWKILKNLKFCAQLMFFDCLESGIDLANWSSVHSSSGKNYPSWETKTKNFNFDISVLKVSRLKG